MAVVPASRRELSQPEGATRPLTGAALTLYPVLRLLVRGQAGLHLRQRRARTAELLQRRADFKRYEREIRTEIRKYAKLIQDRWALMGMAWRYRWTDTAPDDTKKSRRKKVQKVQFELVRWREDAIYYKVLVRKKTMFGYKNMLPYKVMVGDLVGEIALKELQAACERKVSAVWDNPRHGVWIIVHRTEDSGLLPKRVEWDHMLPHVDADMSRGYFVIGVRENNRIYQASLADRPHILIAGASNSGKSTMLNNILSTWVRFATPDEIKLILIDPKRVELVQYKDAPHLAEDFGIIFDFDRALKALDWALREIHRRTDILATNLVTNIATWNKKYPNRAMPRLVIVIEELASLYPDPRSSTLVKDYLAKITNMGRAMGVHLIACTQLPIKQVIPSNIKVNMWLRIAGRVQNPQESMVILGTGDAAWLPAVPGRMVAAGDGYKTEVQTPYIGQKQIFEAIAIANGRRLEILTMYGHEPRIVPGKLLEYIIKHLKGTLSLPKLVAHFADAGCTEDMLKAFLEDVFRAGNIQLGDTVYRPTRLKGEKEWELTRIIVPLAASTGQPPADESIEQAKPDQAAKIVAEMLLLPAYADTTPLQPSVPAEPEAAKPAPQIVVTYVDDKEVFKQFVEDCLILDHLADERAGRLYKAYEKWCSDKAERPVSKIMFGKLMKNAGFGHTRKNGGYHVWIGVRIDPQWGEDEDVEVEEQQEASPDHGA